MGPIALRKAIGATRTELRALEEDGVLIPRTKVPTIKSPWRVSDGLALVQELERRAVPVSGPMLGWETILLAQKRSNLPIGQIIEAINEGVLVAGKCEEVFGYHSVVVKCCEVDRLKTRKPSEAGPAPIDGEMNAAAFARSVGVRQKGTILTLITGGHAPATQALNPTTKRKQLRMTEQDIAAFCEKFTTSTLMAAKTGLHRNTILAALAARRIEAFRSGKDTFAPIYLREVVDPILVEITR